MDDEKKSFMPIRSSRNSNTPRFVIAFHFCLNSLSLNNIFNIFLPLLQNLHKLKSPDETLVAQPSTCQKTTWPRNSSRVVPKPVVKEAPFALATHKTCCETRPPSTESCLEESISIEERQANKPLRRQPRKPPGKPSSQEIKPDSPPIKPPSSVQQIPSLILQQQPQSLSSQGIKSTVCIIQNFGGNPLNGLPSCQPNHQLNYPTSCPLVYSPVAPQNIPLISKSKETELKTNPTSSTDIEIEMGQDIGSCCAKYILCLFNFIFFVSILRFASASPASK